MEMDEFSNAVANYERAVDYKENKSFTPIYLKKLAIAQEQSGDLGAAAKTYGTIIKDYPSSTEIHDARKQKARLEALAQ